MVYIVIALSFGFAGGFVGKIKGSSFFLWFIISATFPIIGLAAAVLYRFDTEEPRRHCPTCGHVCMIHDALCTRCGTELDFPDESEILPPVAPA
jgi:DNA-directed RNA polymerase subunit RPC12/RpoP